MKTEGLAFITRPFFYVHAVSILSTANFIQPGYNFFERRGLIEYVSKDECSYQLS